MRGLSFILLLATLLSCSSAIAPKAWERQTMRLALALEQVGADTQAAVVTPFAPHSAQRILVDAAGVEVAYSFSRQVMAWKALDAYTTDILQILGEQELEEEQIKHVALAFHDLHIHLLQSNVTHQLGLSVATHESVVQKILQSQSTLTALEAAQPAIIIICQHLAEASLQLENQLDQWLNLCLEQVDSKWKQELDHYAVMLERKQRMERQMAAQLAGAMEKSADPTGELLKIETLLRNEETWRRQYREDQKSLELAFRRAKSHVQKTAHAVLEWGIAHRELTKSLRRGNAHVNLRLLTASADELAPVAQKNSQP